MKPAGRWADFHVYELDSHIPLFVQPTTRFKNALLRLFIRTPLGERVSETALLPHVLSRGTRKLPTMARITRHLDSLYGASASSDAVRIGENHVIAVRVDVVADRHVPGRRGNVRRGMELLRDLATDPVREGKSLRGEYVDQERHNQKRAIEDLVSNREEYASHRCLEIMCAGEPYATLELGTVEGLEALTPAGLTARHRELLETAPIEMYVSGRVEPAEVAEMAEELFAIGRRRAPREIPDARVDVGVKAPRRTVETMDVEQGKLVMGFRTYTTYRDRLSTALSFLNGIFGAYAHSRLFVNVRERDGLAYSAGSSLDKVKGVMMAHAGIDAARYEKCVEVIVEEMDSLKAGKITDAEMESTRRAMSERARSVLDSPSRALSGLFERRLAGRVQTVEEALAEIAKTTKADVVEAAKRVVLDTVYFLAPPRAGS